jgi:hypothetical protein
MTGTDLAFGLLAGCCILSLLVAAVALRAVRRLRAAVGVADRVGTSSGGAGGIAPAPAVPVARPDEVVVRPTPLGGGDEPLEGPVRTITVSTAVAGSLIKVAAL